MRYTGLLLLSFWLCLTGFQTLFKLRFAYDYWIAPGLALAAGLVLLLACFRRFSGNFGLGWLSLWLLLMSTMQLFKYSFPYSETSLAVIGLISAVFLLLKK